MGKAKRFKEERRVERESQAVRNARRGHVRRWVAFLAGFTLLAVVILPGLYDRYGNDFLRKQPFNWGNTMNDQQDKPVITIQTEKGTIVVELDRNAAPKTVEHITKLVASGYYDGLNFNRVVPGFVVQGGDPAGTDKKADQLDFEKNDLKHEKGVIAMARAQDKNSASGQFYITLEAQPSLDSEYVVFGKVTSGMEVVDKIVQGDKMTAVTLK